MVFSSYIFILVFLPLVVLIYYSLSYVKNSIYQRLFLIAVSLVFYGYYNVYYLLLIISSIAVNYLAAKQIQKRSGGGAKVFLTAGVLFNVALIGYFKYYDFFIGLAFLSAYKSPIVSNSPIILATSSMVCG